MGKEEESEKEKYRERKREIWVLICWPIGN